MWTHLNPTGPVTVPVWIVAAVLAVVMVVAVVAGVLGRRRRRSHTGPASGVLRQLLVATAVVAAIGVAVVGGVRSFEAVSVRFGSPLVPLTADGMIVACTALRIAALTKGWRIPGALATTYLFIGGTVWLNVAAAHDWSDAVAHALAPISYAILVEMLAHLLRLHLHLTTPPPLRRRVAALGWVTSPVVSTRVWLHLARSGGTDLVAGRAEVQQLVRLSSRLQTVCPSTRPWPAGHARRARIAALQVVRDGLMTAKDLAGLLPADGSRLAPGALLARVDKAALRCTAPVCTGAPTSRADPAPPARTAAPHRPRTSAPTADEPTNAPARAATPSNGTTGGTSTNGAVAGGRSDEDLVDQLRRMDGPLSGRQVMRALSVGTGRAKRLIELAGWATADQLRRMDGPLSGRQVMRALSVGTGRAKRLIELAGWATADQRPADGQPAKPNTGDAAETEPTDQTTTRTNR